MPTDDERLKLLLKEALPYILNYPTGQDVNGLNAFSTKHGLVSRIEAALKQLKQPTAPAGTAAIYEAIAQIEDVGRDWRTAGEETKWFAAEYLGSYLRAAAEQNATQEQGRDAPELPGRPAAGAHAPAVAAIYEAIAQTYAKARPAADWNPSESVMLRRDAEALLAAAAVTLATELEDTREALIATRKLHHYWKARAIKSGGGAAPIEAVAVDTLDWNRLRSGDRRALNPENQPLFDQFFSGCPPRP